MYPHNHDPAYEFLQDGPLVTVSVSRQSGLPLPTPQIVRGESGKRLMQHYLDITNPSSSSSRWTSTGRTWLSTIHRWRYDWEGNRVEDIFDPLATVAAQTQRFALYHAKDGDRRARRPAPATATR